MDQILVSTGRAIPLSSYVLCMLDFGYSQIYTLVPQGDLGWPEKSYIYSKECQENLVHFLYVREFIGFCHNVYPLQNQINYKMSK